MLFKFIGCHTNGRTMITYGDVTFHGDEPASVTDQDLIRRLSNSPEFEAVDALDHDGDGRKGGSLPDDDVVRSLRAQYKALTGKKPFHGWSEETLREKLAG